MIIRRHILACGAGAVVKGVESKTKKLSSAAISCAGSQRLEVDAKFVVAFNARRARSSRSRDNCAERTGLIYLELFRN